MPVDEIPPSSREPGAGSEDPPRPKQSGAPNSDSLRLVPVVGIVASAGGLKAFQTLLAHLQHDTGMGYVLIQHLAPQHKSILTELLAKHSPLPVQEVTDGLAIEPDHVYVIPPGQQLSLLHNALHFAPDFDGTQRYHPADMFLQSLAEDRGSAAIGVVLSGTASDGTRGCCAIKEHGGITFAQDVESAEHDGMPSSAVAAGCIDFVMNPADIARQLQRIALHPAMRPQFPVARADEILAVTVEQMNKIFILLRSRTGQDFSYYKPTTIKRRINRRMMVHKVDSVAHYIKLLQKEPLELDRLFHDILINVTAFFRDPGTFAELRRSVFPKILQNRPPDMPIRVWVPACSSGQEAYSIAMALDEYLGEQTLNIQLQVFGSDIDDSAIEAARNGVFTDAALDEVSPARQRNYFTKEAGGNQVNRALRDMCVFAVQNVTRDPPFSRIDLISCRNLLIYLNAALQKKVLQLIHYALQPGGFLLLGASETIGGQSDLFSPVDKKHKIYQKKAVASRINGDLAFRPTVHSPTDQFPRRSMIEAEVYDIEKVTERILFDRFLPPAVVVRSDQSIMRFVGRTWPYIEPAAGAASLNLYKNAHPDILVELRAAVHAATKSGEATRKDDVRLLVDGEDWRVNIQVIPLGGAIKSEDNFLVVFEPRPAPRTQPLPALVGEHADAVTVGDLLARNAELERELLTSREYMNSIVDEQERSNDALRSANEEIQSTNEELQSTNEELETAKEELQSANEELATVNEELETRNQETSRANNDLINLLGSINLPIVILGADLRIRQFTRPAHKLLNLIDSDVGRPIGNIKANIDIPNLEAAILHVIDSMETQTLELQDNAGHWYSVRMRPYRTLDKRIDGAVIAFIDIDEIKDIERIKAALAKERRLATIVRDSNDAITLLGFDGRIKAWNPAAQRLYGYSEAEALGMNVRQLVAEKDLSALLAMFDELRTGRDLAPIEIERVTRDGRKLRIRLVASVLLDEQRQPVAVATTERLV